MPVYNSEKWILKAIESIKKQTFSNFRLLVIYDDSTDRTLEIISKVNFPLMQIVRGPGKGLSAALRLGIEMSTTPFVARQDADDISYPERFQIQIDHMLSHPDCVLLGSASDVINEDGVKTKQIRVPISNKAIKACLYLFNPFVHTSVMMRREAVIKSGNYKKVTQKIFAEDYDLWKRMASLGEFHNFPNSLVIYRKNMSALTSLNEIGVRRSACLIAIDAIQKIRSTPLTTIDKRIISMFFGQEGRTSPSETIEMYKLMLGILRAENVNLLSKNFPARYWLLPIIKLLWPGGKNLDLSYK